MVCPKINPFAEQETSAEVENVCTQCIQLLQSLLFFTSSQRFCFAFFDSHVPCSEEEPKQMPKTLSRPVVGLHVLSHSALEKLSFLKISWSLGQQSELGPSNFLKVIKNYVFIKGRKGNI